MKDSNGKPEDIAPEKVTIEFTKNEALVLYELISRISKNEPEDLFVDQSELRALWNFECLFEAALVDFLFSDYPAHLKKARDELRDPPDMIE